MRDEFPEVFEQDEESVSHPDSDPRFALADPGLDAADIAQQEVGEGDVEYEAKQESLKSDDPCIAALDALIQPRNGSHPRYRGKLESQVAIAETSLLLGDRVAGNLFDLSQPQTQAYRNSLSSTADITNGNPPKPALKKRVDAIKEELAEAAGIRLKQTLGFLSPEKLSRVKRATNLSKIAKDMAVVLDRCSPKEQTHEGGVHFHIMKPEVQRETVYDVVKIGSGLSLDAGSGEK
jgi:hypothetical protein